MNTHPAILALVSLLPFNFAVLLLRKGWQGVTEQKMTVISTSKTESLFGRRDREAEGTRAVLTGLFYLLLGAIFTCIGLTILIAIFSGPL